MCCHTTTRLGKVPRYSKYYLTRWYASATRPPYIYLLAETIQVILQWKHVWLEK